MAVQQVHEFALWREGYGGATVNVYIGASTDLAPIFLDEGLTQPAANPQTLNSKEEDGRRYGKFAQPIYVNGPYSLGITGAHVTGVTNPSISMLDGEDASGALVTGARSAYAIELRDYLELGEVLAGTHGAFGTDPSSNTAIINTAIGVATSQGGGLVRLPAGVIPVNPFVVPLRVVVAGAGKDVTTLECSQDAAVITISGNYAGLAEMTVDGQTLPPNSRGVLAEMRTGLQLHGVKISRYNKGLYCRGGLEHSYSDLDLYNCATGGEFEGDPQQAESMEFRNLRWSRGRAELCTVDALLFKEVSGDCADCLVREVHVDLNAATGLHVQGAKRLVFENCTFTQHVADAIWIEDALPAGGRRPVRNVRFPGIRMEPGAAGQAGDVKLNGTCQAVRMENGLVDGVRFEIVTPRDPIILSDCIENYTILGDTTRVLSERRTMTGQSTQITGDATFTRAWALSLDHGQVCVLEIAVTANGLTDPSVAAWTTECVARRLTATLNYDQETVAFTVGEIVTGQTSGASARAVEVNANNLRVRQVIEGPDNSFIDNEPLHGDQTGRAVVNGTLVSGGDIIIHETNQRMVHKAAAWTATDIRFRGSAEEVEIDVKGLANTSIEWTVQSRVTFST